MIDELPDQIALGLFFGQPKTFYLYEMHAAAGTTRRWVHYRPSYISKERHDEAVYHYARLAFHFANIILKWETGLAQPKE